MKVPGRKAGEAGWEKVEEAAGRTSADEWAEEAMRQSAALAAGDARAAEGQRLFNEFRRKVATGESMSAAAERIAAALRFCGRITITFHQGKVTKTVLEESYFKGGGAM